jgi:hypothetical protein
MGSVPPLLSFLRLVGLGFGFMDPWHQLTVIEFLQAKNRRAGF